jgi:hypothetical protein
MHSVNIGVSPISGSLLMVDLVIAKRLSRTRATDDDNPARAGRCCRVIREQAYERPGVRSLQGFLVLFFKSLGIRQDRVLRWGGA